MPEIIQLLMLIVKYYIYMCRNNKCAMNFKVYKLYVKTFYQTQREIALSKNDIDNFQKKMVPIPMVNSVILLSKNFIHNYRYQKIKKTENNSPPHIMIIYSASSSKTNYEGNKRNPARLITINIYMFFFRYCKYTIITIV